MQFLQKAASKIDTYFCYIQTCCSKNKKSYLFNGLVESVIILAETEHAGTSVAANRLLSPFAAA